MKFGVLGFGYENFGYDRQVADRGYFTVNLGDNTQTLAAHHVYRQLGISDNDIVRVDRDTLPAYSGPPTVLIMNGVFLDWSFPVPPTIIPIFVGFHAKESVIKGNIDYFKRHEPIGCRDSGTTALMQSYGIEAYTSGCITLAFPRREQAPVRPKLLVVYGGGADLPSEILRLAPPNILATAEFIFHRLPLGSFPLSERDLLLVETYEEDLLRQYRERATLVLTCLHHVATPCLAMGIPVIVARRHLDVRFSFLEELIPIYTTEKLRSVDWQTGPVDIDHIRIALIESVASRIASIRQEWI